MTSPNWTPCRSSQRGLRLGSECNLVFKKIDLRVISQIICLKTLHITNKSQVCKQLQNSGEAEKRGCVTLSSHTTQQSQPPC